MMKVCSFKIFEKQSTLLRALVEAGLYSSLSEAARIAIWDYLDYILIPLKSGKKQLKVFSNKVSKELETHFIGTTVPICAKLPLQLLNMIDYVVLSIPEFSSRSDFFRSALIGFLVSDSKLFSRYLLGDGS